MYAGMIVGYRQINNIVTIVWIGPGDKLCRHTVKYHEQGHMGVVLPFVHNCELYALMIDYDKRPYDRKVVKVSDFVECSGTDTYSLLKTIGVTTYIYIPAKRYEQRVRVEVVGDACNVEVLPHNGFWHYDGERYWKYQKNLSGPMQYISSDPAYSFEMPNRFGSTQDTRNGMILNLDMKLSAGSRRRYTIYIMF